MTVVGRERVVTASRADRAEIFVALHERFEHRARVVVEPTRDRKIGDACARHRRVNGADHEAQFLECVRDVVARDPERSNLVGEVLVSRLDTREGKAAVSLLFACPHLFDEELAHLRFPHLCEFVELAQNAFDIAQAKRLKNPLRELAIVNRDGETGNRKLAKYFGHDDRDVGIHVRRQSILPDDVDIGLVKLPKATVLGTLAAPHLLDLVAAEREREVVLVLKHVARERNGEVKVKAEFLAFLFSLLLFVVSCARNPL